MPAETAASTSKVCGYFKKIVLKEDDLRRSSCRESSFILLMNDFRLDQTLFNIHLLIFFFLVPQRYTNGNKFKSMK